MNEESCGLFFVDDVQFQYSAASPAPGLSWVFVYPVRISAGIVEEYQGNRWEQIETSEADIKGGPQKVSYIRFGKIRYEKTYDELGIAFDPTEAAHEIELKNILEKMIRENVKPDTE